VKRATIKKKKKKEDQEIMDTKDPLENICNSKNKEEMKNEEDWRNTDMQDPLKDIHTCWLLVVQDKKEEDNYGRLRKMVTVEDPSDIVVS